MADKIANMGDLLATPPHNWTPAHRIGYFYWCAAVINALGSVDIGLERQAHGLLLEVGVDPCTPDLTERLEAYYAELEST